ncbi:MAG: helix-turn-helix domain-containing protein [Solobacterium sp.]|nr:helix-turn-helix domain-containing protein [Solobacterium sp.]
MQDQTENSANIICCGENYIAGISSTFGAKLHRHPLIEIYAACDGNSHVVTDEGILQGEIIIIGPDTVHAISDTGKPGIAVFLDPLSESGYSLYRNTLDTRPVCTAEADGVSASLLAKLSADSIRTVSEHILAQLQGEPVIRPFDESVLRTVDLLSDETCSYDMNTLAEKVFLSKSRLAHVFSEQTGITLKEYLQYKRLEGACRKIMKGANITEAAFDTGFSGSSHIAASSMKLTGMQLRKMLSL